jgi:imidazolonepropionase-like amidohydrolase
MHRNSASMEDHMRVLAVFLTAVACLLAIGGVLVAASPALVIQHVTVIDATGKPEQPDMSVVVDQGRIAAIGPSKSAKVPASSQVIDGRGKFLIPGLWDMHVHEASNIRHTWSYPLYIANGVVGVRDMWGPSNAATWRVQHAAYSKPAPTLYLGSPIIDGPEPDFPGSVVVANAAQGRAAVDLYKGRGADFIKVLSRVPREAYFAVADEARKMGMPFAGHVPYSVTVEEASDAGQTSMEHLYGVALGTSAQEEILLAEAPKTMRERARRDLRAFESYDETKAGSLFARFVRNGTWQSPTLTELRSVSHLLDPEFVNDERLKYIPGSLRTQWDPKNDKRFSQMTADDQTARRELFSHDLKLVGRMHQAGVGILAGTDTMNPYCFPGFSLHDELALLVEAGLSPMAAVQAATRNPARLMSQSDRRGTIETGKIADLVLLDRDPLADIHNTRSIRAVVLQGKFLPRTELDEMLSAAELEAARLPISKVLAATIKEKDVATAVQQYRDMKSTEPAKYDFDADELLRLGYGLLGTKRTTDAIEIFKLSVEVAPDYSDTYDSLAEAYMDHGDKELAIKNYKKSLELEPDNTNAVEKIKQLDGP